ncbi:putative DNA methylase [Methanocella paludicola SANAE]|uniref:Type II methyltransferase n=1 Tax=Methanocella paludicola (strain DSM 17711 / JCM 13418 / NBRC 101707 / SANAE) TaxID=304371 RepID=D1Z0R6_METPS|nr:site-specific DNA-methyltransferase [Methanocella paludicola]BAI62288.1 putative DNA methylase [Methanocella paludicola SANAE]
MKSKTGGTKTSSFGSSGRENHDSSIFYNSRLYSDYKIDKTIDFTEYAIPSNNLDKIFCKSSEHMEELPDNSVHLMVTSPPYNVGKEYDENLSLKEYLDFLANVWRDVYRVLVPGGRVCLNVANLGRKPYLPLHSFIIKDMLDIGFLMRGEIIWNKASSAGGSTAWGSFQSASNPTLRDVHEYIMIFSKQSFSRNNDCNKKSSITKEEFLEYTKSIWSFKSESATKIGHPAPYPIELPLRCIKLYTFEDDIILDPFMGSGTTAIAALQVNRHFVGYDIDKDYIAVAEKRIKKYRDSLKQTILKGLE